MVGVLDKGGALLVSDDTAGVIWRVQAPGATPSIAPPAVATTHLPPQRELKGSPGDQLEATWKPGGTCLEKAK